MQLLPQSQAYRTLSDRLVTVSSLQMHIGFSESRQNYHIDKSDVSQQNSNNDYNNTDNNNNKNNNNVNNNNNSNINNDNMNNNINKNKNKNNVSHLITSSSQHDRVELDNLYTDLLAKFQLVQERHVTFRLSLITQKKINKANSGIHLKLGSGINVIPDDGMDSGSAGSIFAKEV